MKKNSIFKAAFRFSLILAIGLSFYFGIKESVDYRNSMFVINGCYEPIILNKSASDTNDAIKLVTYKAICAIKINQGMETSLAYMFTDSMIKQDSSKNLDSKALCEKYRDINKFDEETKDFFIQIEKNRISLVFEEPLLNYILAATDSINRDIELLNKTKNRKTEIEYKEFKKYVIPGFLAKYFTLEELDLISKTFPDSKRKEMKTLMEEGKDLVFVTYYPTFNELLLRSTIWIGIYSLISLIIIYCLRFLALLSKKVLKK